MAPIGPRTRLLGYPPHQMSMFRSDTAAMDGTGEDAPATMVHWVDGRWSALRYRTAGGLTVLESRRCTDDEIAAWCGEGIVRVVIGAASTLARTISLGHGDTVDLEHHVADQAWEQFGDGTPAHRMGSMVLPEGAGDAGRVGVMTAWPEHTEQRMPGGVDDPLCVPDIVGLLSVLGTSRPDVPLYWVDPADNSVALVIAGMGHVAIRSTHADLGDNPSGAVAHLVLEACINAGWSADEARALAANVTEGSSDTPHLGLPTGMRDELIRRCAGDVPEDLDRFGIMLACALATTDDCAALTLMRPSLPEVVPTLADRVQDRLSDRAMAIRLVAVFLLALMFAPLAFNGVRLALLSMAHGDIERAVLSASASEQRNRMYRQLGQGSLPVTKLLADIGAATPLGIRIDTIRMGAGEPLRINGSATKYQGQMPADLITMMKEELGRHGVFQDVSVDWGARSNMNQREFSLSADIGRAPHRPGYDLEQDYAAWTYQQRKHDLPQTDKGGPPARPSLAKQWVPGSTPADGGPTASTTTGGDAPSPPPAGSAAPIASAPGGDDTAAPSTPLAGGSSTLGNGLARPAGGGPVRPGIGDIGDRPDRPGVGVAASDTGSQSVAGDGFKSGDAGADALVTMPQILTDEQIASLGKDETMARINEVSSIRGRNKDPENERILADYFTRLFAHLRKVDAEKKKQTP